MTEETEFQSHFWRELASVASCADITAEILNYNGPSTNPKWMDSEPGERHNGIKFSTRADKKQERFQPCVGWSQILLV